MVRPAAVIMAVLLGLYGCARHSAAATTQGPPVDRARIGLTEWTIVHGGQPLPPGDITLVVTNTGATAHDLVISARHGQWRTPVLAPGEHAELRVRADPGEVLHAFCDLAGHHRFGMHAQLPIADDPIG